MNPSCITAPGANTHSLAKTAATSYGEKEARNVGVIGVAMYEEDEIARRRRRVEENYVRDGARAFGN